VSERTDRFRAQKARKSRREVAILNATESLLPLPAIEGVDRAYLAHLALFDAPVDVSVGRAEVEELLSALSNGDAQARFDRMLGECKSGIAQAIAGPFGVGRIVSRWDQTGGNVDTIHNAREGVYATPDERATYEARAEYDHEVSEKYHSHANYISTNAKHSEQFKDGATGAEDIYTGERLRHGQDKVNLDHIRSAKETHDDAGIYLAGLDPVDVASRQANLGPTRESINKSKKAKTPSEFLDYLEQGKPERQAVIERLQSKEFLTEKEQHQLQKLRQLEQVQEERVKHADEKATEDRESVINGTYYGGEKFKNAVLKTGAKEAGKLAFQQLLGEALSEFFLAVVDEISDWNQQGRKDLMLTQRLQRIAHRVVDKWKDFLDAAWQGALSGFLSNLATVIINVFATTEKRLVRMIREGFFSLLRALKMLIFPPTDMTYAEAMHAATKVAFAGGILIGGLALEEIILKQLQAFGLGFVADFATAAIVGSTTAIAIALTAYAIDRLDLLGVEADAKHDRTLDILDHTIDASIQSIEQTLAGLRALDLKRQT